MIAKVGKRGSRIRGLLEYLWSEGRANEHENPRVVGASNTTFIRDENAPMFDAFERKLLAYELEGPMRMRGIEPGEHVYHVPVSISVDDGTLSDEQWREVAENAAEKLGLNAGPNRSQAPWIAVRHGAGSGGQDHIHFVAVLYRESGHKVDRHNDAYTWQQVRHEAEEKWNLTRTRGRGGGVPDLKRGELERADREQRSEPARERLARTVRSAATAARDEADFVHRVRQAEVLIRPRWQQGGQKQVVGYSVALRPPANDKPIWYGGGKLADDLTLSALRSQWPESSRQQQDAAVTAWLPADQRHQQRARELRAEAWQTATSKTAEVRQALSQIDPHDQAAWASVSRDAAGALSALADRVPRERRGELRRAASALGRAAQTDRNQSRAKRPEAASPLAGVVRTASDAQLAARGGPYGTAQLVMQLGRLVQAVQTAHVEAGRVPQAQRSETAAREMLEFVRQTPTADRTGQNRAVSRQPERTMQPHERPYRPTERTRDDRER